MDPQGRRVEIFTLSGDGFVRAAAYAAKETLVSPLLKIEIPLPTIF